jgi:hypothetical protein
VNSIVLGPDSSPRVSKGGVKQAAEKLAGTFILRATGDGKSRTALKTVRARSFAALRMTVRKVFFAACKASPAPSKGSEKYGLMVLTRLGKAFS